MTTRSQYQSNVFLYGAGGEDKNFSIDTVTVTMQAGMKSGAVLEEVGGKYIWVVALNTANASAVLLDERADQLTELTAGDHTLKVIKRAAGLGQNYLTYAEAVDSAQQQAAEDALKALGMKVETQV